MKNTSFQIMLFPLLFILMPRSSVNGAEFLTYPAMLLILLLLILMQSYKIGVPVKSIKYIGYLLGLISILFISILLSNNAGLGMMITVVSKYGLFTVILIYSINVARNYDSAIIKSSLLKAAYIIMLFQGIFVAIQLIDLRIFGYIYSMEKTKPLGNLVRVAGTLSNPNFFAWIMIQMAVIFQLFETGKKKKLFMILLAFIFVVLSGSRTSLVVFPIIIMSVYFLITKKNISFILFKIPLMILALLALWKSGIWFLKTFYYQFPYLSQLLSIIETNDIKSVNSFNERTLMWRDASEMFNNYSGPFKYLFGLGPGSIEVLDNDYLYSFYNNGIIFTVMNILMYIVMLIVINQIKDKKLKVLGMQYIIFSLALGMQSDTMSGWNYPLLAFYYFGLIYGIRLQMFYKNDSLKPLLN